MTNINFLIEELRNMGFAVIFQTLIGESRNYHAYPFIFAKLIKVTYCGIVIAYPKRKCLAVRCNKCPILTAFVLCQS